MKTIVAGFLFCVSSHSMAQSDAPILLKPMSSDSEVSVTKVMNIYGNCGDSVVAILGVEADGFGEQNYFKIDVSGNSDLQVRTGGKEISFQYTLSDYNMAHCVRTKSGERLLIGSSCAGSMCGDAHNYYIINTKNGSVFPSKGAKQLCDTDCANKALGFKYIK